MRKTLSTERLTEIDKISAKIERSIYMNGRYINKRTIGDISESYQAAYKVRRRIIDGPWKDWWTEGEKLGCFWGYSKDKNGGLYKVDKLMESVLSSDKSDKSVPIFFGFDNMGYSRNVVEYTNYRHLVQMMNPEEIPLHVSNPDYATYRPYMLDILKGRLNSAPRRQDLIDEHGRLECRLRHVNYVSEVYVELLSRYVKNKYSESKTYFGSTSIFILKVGSYKYSFKKDHSDTKFYLIHDDNITNHEAEINEILE